MVFVDRAGQQGAYWDPVKAGEIFRAAGLDSEFVKVGSTDCYVAWRDGVVIVAFRGTEPDEWQDMLTNSKIQLVPWSTGMVHRGFKKAIDDVWPTLEPKLNALAGRELCPVSRGARVSTYRESRMTSWTQSATAFISYYKEL